MGIPFYLSLLVVLFYGASHCLSHHYNYTPDMAYFCLKLTSVCVYENPEFISKTISSTRG